MVNRHQEKTLKYQAVGIRLIQDGTIREKIRGFCPIIGKISRMCAKYSAP